MTALRIPNLAALRAFEATVRHGSVRAAAAELHLTDGAVSRAVREVEAQLGFDLFVRTNRLLRPTPIASTLAQDIARGLGELAEGVARARRRREASPPLVLSCEPTFLIKWLIPRLAGLQAALGEARELRLVSAGGPVPFAQAGVDLAIRREDFPIVQDVVVEPFLDERVGPVGRPEVISAALARGEAGGVHLHTETRPDAWETWARLTGRTLRPAREQRFEHFYLTLQAAASGAGLAIGPVALVADDLVSGVLVAPCGLVADGSRYVLMTPRADTASDAFARTLDWLGEAVMPLRVVDGGQPSHSEMSFQDIGNASID